MRFRKIIPNTITLINLFLGCCALAHIFKGDYEIAIKFVFLGLLSDFLDGYFARRLKVNSPLGKQLDSLADMVTFGVIPGSIVFSILSHVSEDYNYLGMKYFYPYVGFFITLMSALRLGRFNLDERQEYGFIGLNTPACTLFFVGILSIFQNDSYGLAGWVSFPPILISLSLIFSYLLLAPLPMFSFKIKSGNRAGAEFKILFVGLSLLLLVFWKDLGLCLIIIAYILIAILLHLKNKKRTIV